MDDYDDANGAISDRVQQTPVRCRPTPRCPWPTSPITTSIANAATRDEMLASRARIVAAADDARRRIERDLHDGAQQRLVALGLGCGPRNRRCPTNCNRSRNSSPG